MLVSYGVAAGIGAAIGIVGGGAYCYHRFKGGNGKTSSFQKITYSDLIKFANKCKSRVPGIVKCRVVCEILDDGTFRITQLMLNEKLIAIKTNSGDIVGRIVTCREIDDKIRTLSGSNFPADFDFGV